MKVAILETGRPPGDLDQQFGDYSAMFRQLLGRGFEIESFDVPAGKLPDPTAHHAYMLTGSPAGVYEPLPWIEPLQEFIRSADGAKMVGICFGHQIMAEALEQARKGRLYILGAMEKTLAAPRESISALAPRIIQIRINPDKIRDVIGPGGKVIRSLVEETGAKIDVSDDGTISIATASGEAADAAVNRIRGLTAEAEVGQTYLGTVNRIVDFGAFVEIFPGTDGLLHISEIADRRVKDVRDELKEGQQIMVKCIGREGNKIKLSRKAVLRDENRKAEAASQSDSEM